MARRKSILQTLSDRAHVLAARGAGPVSNLARPKSLVAVYDLAYMPCTYDFVSFLVLAQEAAEEANLRDILVAIVPGRVDDIWVKERNVLAKADNYWWRVYNILVPSVALIAGARPYVAQRGEVAHLLAGAALTFPHGYELGKNGRPLDGGDLITLGGFRGLAVPAGALYYTAQWCEKVAGGKPLVSITLRESSYHTERNSNIGEWAKVAAWLREQGYQPVFVRDTEKSFLPPPDPLKNEIFFAAAAHNVLLRAALYEKSFIHLTVNTGPAALSLCNKRSRCLYFKVVSAKEGSASMEHWRRRGLEEGDQLPYVTGEQRLVWKDDRFEYIRDAFLRLMSDIQR